MITTFTLNIILVLEGGRLVYRSAGEISYVMIPIVEKLCPDIRIIHGEEPLIYLEKNKNIIKKIFIENENYEIAMGKILGYHYNGTNWHGKHDKYGISYKTKITNFYLYTFICPLDEYTEDIRSKVLLDCVKFNSILKSYGYEIEIQTLLTGRYVDLLDYLPTAFALTPKY